MAPAYFSFPVDTVYRRETSDVVQKSSDDASTVYNHGPAEIIPDYKDDVDDTSSGLVMAPGPVIPILPDPIKYLPPMNPATNPALKRIHYLPLGPGPVMLGGQNDGVPILPRGEMTLEHYPVHHPRPFQGPSLSKPLASPLSAKDFPIEPRDDEIHQPEFEIYKVDSNVPAQSVSALSGASDPSIKERDIEEHQKAPEIYLTKPKVPVHSKASLSGTKTSPVKERDIEEHEKAYEIFAAKPNSMTPPPSPLPRKNRVSFEGRDVEFLPPAPEVYIAKSNHHDSSPQGSHPIHLPKVPQGALHERATKTQAATDEKVQARNDIAQADAYTLQPAQSLYRRIMIPTAVSEYDSEYDSVYDTGLETNAFNGPPTPGHRGPGPVVFPSHRYILPINMPRDSMDDGNDGHHDSAHHSKQHEDDKSETSNPPHKNWPTLESSKQYTHGPKGQPNSQLPATQHQMENAVFDHVQHNDKREADHDHDSDRHDKNSIDDNSGGRGTRPDRHDKLGDPDFNMPDTHYEVTDPVLAQSRQDKREADHDHGSDRHDKDLNEDDRPERHDKNVQPNPQANFANPAKNMDRVGGVWAQKINFSKRDALPKSSSEDLEAEAPSNMKDHPLRLHQPRGDVHPRNAGVEDLATLDEGFAGSTYTPRSSSRVWRHARRDGLFSTPP